MTVISSAYQRLLANPTTFDAKRSNCFLFGSNFVIETIPQFLSRIIPEIRDNNIITIYIPKDGYTPASPYPISTIADINAVLDNYDSYLYAFVGGIDDVDFTMILKYSHNEVDFGTNNVTSKRQDLPTDIGIVAMPTHTKNIDGTVTLGNDGVFNFSETVDGSGALIELPIETEVTLSLTDNTVNFIYADYNNGSPIYAVDTNNLFFLTDFTKIPVLRTTREGTTIHFEEYDLYGMLLAYKIMIKDILINGARRYTGLVLSTAATRISTVSSGSGFFGVQFYPTITQNVAGSAGLLYEYYLVAGVWNKILRTSYDSSYYSDGTNRQSLNSNKFVAKYFWRDMGDDNEVYFIHGNEYVKESDAINELVPMAPSVMTYHSIYVGKIVIQQGTTNGTAFPRQWEGTIQSAGVASHTDLSNLSWTNSGHTGTANKLAGFDTDGDATVYDLPTDEKVKFDAGDTAAGYLSAKIIAGTNITIEEGTGADENKLKISSTGGGATSYLGLSDTSDTSYTGKDKYLPMVNESTSNLDLTPSVLATLLKLDGPTSYVGCGGYAVVIKQTVDGFEFIPQGSNQIAPSAIVTIPNNYVKIVGDELLLGASVDLTISGTGTLILI